MFSRRCERRRSLLQTLILSWICHVIIARVMTPYEQAVGQWNVTLKANGWNKKEVPSMLFPPIKSAVLSNDVDAMIPPDKNTIMQCQLFLFSNGTFVMNASHKKRMPLRGNWKVQPNPYCITDRQYDQLVLQSYPRLQKQDGRVLQKIEMEMECRVWGRYGSGSIRRFMGHNRVGRSMSRMTHGTLLWNVKESQETKLPYWKSRRVCASFTAKPVESSEEDDDGEEDFDYDNVDF